MGEGNLPQISQGVLGYAQVLRLYPQGSIRLRHLGRPAKLPTNERETKCFGVCFARLSDSLTLIGATVATVLPDKTKGLQCKR
jgi:hypothetical protein